MNASDPSEKAWLYKSWDGVQAEEKANPKSHPQVLVPDSG